MNSHYYTYETFDQRYQQLLDSAERERFARHARRRRRSSRTSHD